MSKLQNISGERFGMLVVMDKYMRIKKQTHWLCVCDCGNEKYIYAGSLKVGASTSCGCRIKKIMSDIGKANKKHGLIGHDLYSVFVDMKRRCSNPSHHAYPSYGGRGIKCLFQSVEEFISWAEKSGYEKGLSIDRIDNNGNYSMENCRFVDMKTQNRNKRNNRVISHNGESLCLIAWCSRLGVTQNMVYGRVRKGQTFEQALGLC